MTITARHPVRNDFSSCSSGPVYYDSKGHAINAFDEALQEHGFRFDYADTQTLYGNEGRKVCDVIPNVDGDFGPADPVGRAVIMWYRMPSGRWEIIGYLA
jgi:hypothetical protein